MRLSSRVLRVGFAACGILVSSPAWAQGAPPAKPYQKLFKSEDLQKSVARALSKAQAEQAARGETTCTMRIIPADPSIDPKIRVGDSTNENTRHTIRIVPPSCKPR